MNHKICLLALMLITFPITGCGANDQETGVIHIIKKEVDITKALPLGSQPSTVTSYLDQAGIKHSGFDANDQTIKAFFQDSKKTRFTTKPTRIDFKFDTANRLSLISISDLPAGS